jgi:hypothetical protein
MPKDNLLFSIVFFCLVSSVIVPYSSEAQAPGIEPQVSVDCKNIQSWHNQGPISYSLGSGAANCIITNEDQRNIKFEVTWMAEKMDVITTVMYQPDEEVQSGDEIELASGEEFELWLYLFPEKMEPGEVSFEVEILVTATEEISGWRDCQNCEPHVFDTEYEIGPWGIIHGGLISKSNIPGIPTGTNLDLESRNTLENGLICSEDLLTQQSIEYSLFLESSTGGRDKMVARSSFEMRFVNHEDRDDTISIEESFESEFDSRGIAEFNATLNLNIPENRTGVWHVEVFLSGDLYGYGRHGYDGDFLAVSCLLNNSILDPDSRQEFSEDVGDLPALSFLSTLTVLLMSALTYARVHLHQIGNDELGIKIKN